MSHPVRALGRALLGTLFVMGGRNQLKKPAHGIAMTDAAKQRYGLAGLPDSAQLVQLNGLAMVAAGTTLALGVAPRSSALLLAGLLQPTNLAGHAFWTIDDPQRAFLQRNEFVANLAVTGGLLLVAAGD